MSRHILQPGVTCAAVVRAPRAGLLIDGRDYYRAFYRAALAAERSILIAGWQFDTRTRLLLPPDDRDAPLPVQLLPFLRALVEARPALEVHVLAWDGATVFALEREWLQEATFRLRGHPRIHYRLDDRHPIAGSEHQKLVVIDRAIGFLGGMDLCASRWDDREHRADDARRARPLVGHYGPYHDVQAYVTGEAVDVLRGWFEERWWRTTGERLAPPGAEPAPADAPVEPIEIEPTLEVHAPRLGLCRTLPPLAGDASTAVHEVRELHRRAIAAARRLIYLENQYFSSDDVRHALHQRLAVGGGPPLELVIVLPARSAGLKEQVSIGVRQAEILRGLMAAAARGGHRFGVYATVAPREGGDEARVEPVFIHAKVLAVDDRFLLVSSANTSNRSMGLDSELGLAWEAPRPTRGLRDARLELLREHVGMTVDEARAQLGPITGLVDRLDAIASARRHRLRLHPIDESGQPGRFLGHLLGDDVPLDPATPVFERVLPDPSLALVPRLFDHAGIALRALRKAARSGRRRPLSDRGR